MDKSARPNSFDQYYAKILLKKVITQFIFFSLNHSFFLIKNFSSIVILQYSYYKFENAHYHIIQNKNLFIF